MRKINITNLEKLQDALNEVQKGCSARIITAKDIVSVLTGIEVPKSRLHGTTVTWDGAESFPGAYKYTPQSTHWLAENVNGRWYVTDIFRCECPNRSTRQGMVYFSDDAKAWIIEQFSMIR